MNGFSSFGLLFFFFVVEDFFFGFFCSGSPQEVKKPSSLEGLPQEINGGTSIFGSTPHDINGPSSESSFFLFFGFFLTTGFFSAAVLSFMKSRQFLEPISRLHFLQIGRRFWMLLLPPLARDTLMTNFKCVVINDPSTDRTIPFFRFPKLSCPDLYDDISTKRDPFCFIIRWKWIEIPPRHEQFIIERLI